MYLAFSIHSFHLVLGQHSERTQDKQGKLDVWGQGNRAPAGPVILANCPQASPLPLQMGKATLPLVSSSMSWTCILTCPSL